MRKILIGIFILTTIFLLVSCAPKKEVTPTEPTITAEEPTTETQIDKDIEEMEKTEGDLDTSDLDNLEKDLTEINW